MDESANWVCRYLPEGWDVVVRMEHGSASVMLIDAEGDNLDEEAFDCDQDNDTLDAKVRRAVAYAQAHA